VRNLDFSSWPALLSTLLGLALITLIGVGIRLLAMHTIQLRRERENRQINERLRTLIAAYKVLGGSFTGELAVDPTHRRELRQRGEAAGDAAAVAGGERRRRMRDAAEAALSDILLLGTEAQVRLAAQAATELVAGRPIHTAALVVSLRDFIRQVLDLDPVPADLPVPRQGPARPGAAGARGKGEGGDGGARGRGGSGSGALGLGMGLGLGGAAPDEGDAPTR